MSEFFSLVVSAVVLGLSAGVSPGPLLAIVISETLKHNRVAGIKVALSPLITDGPILLLSLFLLSRLSNLDLLLGGISLFGACFLAYLGYESVAMRELKVEVKASGEHALRKGILTNALSPHPYLFWVSIGGPLMIKALGISVFALIAFIASFLGCLVGSKIVIALLVEKSRAFLKSKSYLYTVKTLGVALLVFAVLLLKQALEFFKII